MLALVVAVLLVAVAVALHGRPDASTRSSSSWARSSTTKTEAGLYFKVPLLQNVKFYDKRILTLDKPEPDRITTSEKKPLLVDFFVLLADHRRASKYYLSVQGDEEVGAAAARADDPRQPAPRKSTSARCTR